MSLTLAEAAENVGAEVIYRSPVSGFYDDRGVIEGIDEKTRMVLVRYGANVHPTHPVNLTIIARSKK